MCRRDGDSGIPGMMRRGMGFTMVEMLVVVAVILILAGILMSALGSGRESVKYTQAENTIRNLANAMELHKAQFGVYPAKAPNDEDYFWLNPDNSSEGVLNQLMRSGFKPDSQALKKEKRKDTDLNDSVRVMKDPWGMAKDGLDNVYRIMFADDSDGKSNPHEAPWDSDDKWDSVIGDNVDYVIYTRGPREPKLKTKYLDKFSIFNCKPTKSGELRSEWIQGGRGKDKDEYDK